MVKDVPFEIIHVEPAAIPELPAEQYMEELLQILESDE